MYLCITLEVGTSTILYLVNYYLLLYFEIITTKYNRILRYETYVLYHPQVLNWKIMSLYIRYSVL